MERNKLIDIDGLSIFKSQMDSHYALSSEIDVLKDQIKLVSLLASESNFKAEANFQAFNHGFDYLCIECFHDTNDIDTLVDDGAAVVNNYYNATNHLIHKTGTGTMTIQSRIFTLEKTPYEAFILVDYEGSGSVSLQMSKNGGEDWKTIPTNSLTSLNSLVQKRVKVKVIMTGEVILKNIAWGCK